MALKAAVARLVESVLHGDAASSAALRRAAYDGTPDDPAVARYVELVRNSAEQVTDHDVEALRSAGLSEDMVFEVTVAAAVGAAMERLNAGLALIEAAAE